MQLLVGIHAVEAVVRADPGQVSRLMMSEKAVRGRASKLFELAKNQGLAVDQLSPDELRALCGHTRHQGVAAEYAGSRELNEANLRTDLVSAATPHLLLVLDGVTDPHNLGACLRSADAAGVSAVIVPKDNSAALTPAAQKVASGAAARVPLYRVTNLARTLKELKQSGIWIYGAAGGSAHSLYQQDLTGSVALVLGAEGKGLRKLTREACDELYQIPMIGTVESLNVSVAAGISLFEARRQREFLELTAKPG